MLSERTLKKFFSRHGIILVVPALIIFTLLLVPYIGLVPFLDGDVEFLIAHNFYAGHYFIHWMSYHPPLKLILSSFFFSFFGLSSYGLLGFLLGIVGIISVFIIAESLFDKRVAVLSSIFMTLSGLYISAALFSLNDFIVTVFILVAFAFYVKNKFFLYAITVSLAVMAKESAILFPACVLLVEIFHKKFRWTNIFPFLALGGWFLFLNLSGHHAWNDWNFSHTSTKGSIYTIIYNFLALDIFNKYALQNILHLFVLNYNWIFWLFIVFAIPKLKIHTHMIIILLFFLGYTSAVLTFQTFTIPRYVLPLLPFVYILAAYALVNFRFYYIAIPMVILIAGLSLYMSSDPLSDGLWGKYKVLNTSFYKGKYDGIDGIAYNMQFLLVAKQRDTLIREDKYQKRMMELRIRPETLRVLNLVKTPSLKEKLTNKAKDR